ncbi:MAG: hypothetical protein GY845_25475 [Planctomycetes bacterium]|nr:hypothetical protein [Planctomycetota bacterium]
MKELTDLFDAFYRRFVLRDLFGKIVPGVAFIVAIALAVTSTTDIATAAVSMSGWTWFALLAAGWIVGCGIQGIGRGAVIKGKRHRIIDDIPKDSQLDEDANGDARCYYRLQMTFSRDASTSEQQTYERLMVIQEACANGFLSISLSFLLLIPDTIIDICLGKYDFWDTLKNTWPVLFGAFLIGWFLFDMYREHAHRSWLYLTECLNMPPAEKKEEEKERKK